MRERVLPIVICLLLIPIGGCNMAAIFKTLFKPQEWSDNYARYPGVECSVPGLIDGDPSPVNVPRQVTIKFPKRLSIHRIIIKGTNVEDLIVYASLGATGWKEVAKIKNNREETIDLRVHAFTDQLIFRLGETKEDKIVAIPSRVAKETGILHPLIQLGVPRIAEIEIYGFKEKEPKTEELIF